MMRFRVLAMVVALAVVGVARGQVTGVVALYRLGAGSDFRTGCFPPCLCPSLPAAGPPKGTFRLAFAGQNGAIRTYHVRDVNWFVDLPATTALSGGMTRITGAGTYTITTGSVVPLHRLELDLAVGTGAPAPFDSGLVPAAGALFPEILIRVSINGGQCQDTIIDVGAAPVPATQARAYHLENSSYGAGCFPPCCPGPVMQPATGGFTLVPLPHYSGTVSRGSVDYAVLNANWAVGPATTPGGGTYRGDGIYRRRLGPVVTPGGGLHRMVMDLTGGSSATPAAFDSGWKPAPMGPTVSVLPNIDVTISGAAFACQDRRFEVHGRPNP